MSRNVKIANRIRAVVTVVAGAIMVYALFVSADHIIHVAHLIGLKGYQANTLWVLIDIPAVLGKTLRLGYFDESTRRTGLRLMIASGSLSLVCNIASGWFGGGLGPAGYGAFVVIMFVALENVVTKIKPAEETKTTPTPVPQPPAAVVQAAPVSPGMVPVAAPTVATVAAVVAEPENVIRFREAQKRFRATGQI